MNRILVTGAAGWLGGTLVRRLEERPGVEVHAVDEDEPTVPFRSRFVRASPDHLETAEVVLRVRPQVVVHLEAVERATALGTHRAHEARVVGSRALFGAIARTGSVRTVVVRSDAAVYGAGPRVPSVLPESATPRATSGFQRDLLEMEAFIAALEREHPRTIFTVLRPATPFGPGCELPLNRFLHLPVVPTRLGFDPRLQLLHEDDAVAALLHAIDADVPGTFNVAAPGQQYLSRILRMGRRAQQPLPRLAWARALRGLTRVGIDVPPHDRDLLTWGRVMDLTAMAEVFGFRPRWNLRRCVLAGYGRLDEGTPA